MLTLLNFCRFLSRKTVLITGSNEGIGYQTALALAQRNHRIIMVDKKDLVESKEKIIWKTCNSNIVTKCVDFTFLNAIRKFAEEIKNEEGRLDVLINNVGVFCGGRERTDDGLVATMQVNHFGPFLLTHLLAELLIKSAPSRIIFVSSLGAFFNNLSVDNINNPSVSSYDGISSLLVYYNSKLCNMITANNFARKLKKYKVSCNSLHPGMTATSFLFTSQPIFAKPLNFFIQSPELGAQQSIFLSTSDLVSHTSGEFFVNYRPHQQPKILTNRDFCNSIWRESECFVDLKKEERCPSLT